MEPRRTGKRKRRSPVDTEQHTRSGLVDERGSPPPPRSQQPVGSQQEALDGMSLLLAAHGPRSQSGAAASRGRGGGLGKKDKPGSSALPVRKTSARQKERKARQEEKQKERDREKEERDVGKRTRSSQRHAGAGRDQKHTQSLQLLVSPVEESAEQHQHAPRPRPGRGSSRSASELLAGLAGAGGDGPDTLPTTAPVGEGAAAAQLTIPPQLSAQMHRQSLDKNMLRTLLAQTKAMHKHSQFHLLLGLLYLRTGRPREAEKALRRAGELYRPALPAKQTYSQHNAQRLSAQRAQQAKLAACLAQSIWDLSDFQEEGLMTTAGLQRAQDLLEKALRTDPGQVQIWGQYARLLFEAGHEEEARGILDQLLHRVSPRHPLALDLRNNLAVMQLLADLPEAAASNLGQIFLDPSLSSLPRHAALLNNYALLLLQTSQADGAQGRDPTTGRVQEAMHLLECAVEMAPALPHLWTHLAIAYERGGCSALARIALDRARRRHSHAHSTVYSLRFNLANHLKAVAKADPAQREALLASAQRLLETVLDHQPEPEAWVCMGDLYAMKAELSSTDQRAEQFRQQAEHCLQSALQLDPRNILALNQLGLLHLRNRSLPAAEACFRQVLSFSSASCPQSLPVLCNLGIALHINGKLSTAENLYRKALSVFPSSFQIWNNLGNLLRQKGDLVEARACYSKCLELNSTYAPALSNLALLCVLQEQVAEAEGYLRQAEQADPSLACTRSNQRMLAALQRRRALVALAANPPTWPAVAAT